MSTMYNAVTSVHHGKPNSSNMIKMCSHSGCSISCCCCCCCYYCCRSMPFAMTCMTGLWRLTAIGLARTCCSSRMASTDMTQDGRGLVQGTPCMGARAELAYRSDETVSLSLDQPASICCIQFSIQPLVLQQLSSRRRCLLLLLELPWTCCAVRVRCIADALGRLRLTAAGCSTLCFV